MHLLVIFLPMFLLILTILHRQLYFIAFTSNNCRFMNIGNVNVYDFIKKSIPDCTVSQNNYLDGALYKKFIIIINYYYNLLLLTTPSAAPIAHHPLLPPGHLCMVTCGECPSYSFSY